MKRLVNLIPVVAIVLALTSSSCKKKSDSTTTPTTDTGAYFPRVRTIIQGNCLSCHSSTGTWAGRPTAFDTDPEIANLAASIKAAVADPATLTNKRMPEGGSLSSANINIITSWYAKGGKVTD